jgi:hypothetical protein
LEWELDHSLDHDEEDPGVDDVVIIERTPSQEKRFVDELDRELEEYMAKYPRSPQIEDNASDIDDFTVLEDTS